MSASRTGSSPRSAAASGRERARSTPPGKLVLPGGIDSHCHIEQRSSAGVVCADDFYSATVAAAFGGTTTVIPFAAQHRGQSLRQVVAGVSRGGAAQGGHRLRLSPDHHRPDRAGAGPGTAGADPRRLHLVQGLHDLRPAAAQRPADARHPGVGAARGRLRHGPCRESRHDQMADRRACWSAGSARRATTRSATPGSPRARRPTAR